MPKSTWSSAGMGNTSPATSNRKELRRWLWQRAEVLIGVGPDADWRAKLLIYQLMEGAILDAYLQLIV
jgi:hypothetical protein